MRRAVGLVAAAALGAATPLGAQVTARVGGEPTAAGYGTTFTVPITVDMSASGGQLLGSYTARFTWNPAVLGIYTSTCCGQTDSTLVGNFPAPAINTDSLYAGILKFSAISPPGVGGLVTIAQLRFYNFDTIPTPLQLSFSEMSAAGSFANLLPSLTVQSATFCSARGRWGDLDRDGQSNSRDALFVLSQVVGLAVNPLAADTSLADVDSDGRNTSRDALVILSYAVGIPIPGHRVLLPAANACGTGSARQLAVNPSAIDLAVGQAFRLVVQATDSAGRAVSTPWATWRSSDNTVAAVGTDGTVTPRGPGTATITAEVAPGVTATATVTVMARRPNWFVDIAATGRPVQNGSATNPYEHPLRAFPWVGEGDTVRVTTGTYFWDSDGDLDVGIVLLGGTPGDTTTRPVFRDQGSYTGLWLRGGQRTLVRNVVLHNFDQAIELDGVRGLAVEDTKFLFTGSSFGDGIYHCGADMDTVRIDRSAFIGDPQFGYGDAVYVSGCSQVAVRVMLFRDSRIQNMSNALYMYGVDSLVVLRSRITDNDGYGIYMSQEYNETPALYVAHSRVERNRYFEIRGDDMRRVVIDTSVIRADTAEALNIGGDFNSRQTRIYLHGDSIYDDEAFYNWLSVYYTDSLVIEDLVLRAPDDTSVATSGNVDADVAIVRRSRFLNLGGGGNTAFNFTGRRLLADSVTMTGCAVSGCDQAYGFTVNAAGTQPSAQILRSSFTQLSQPIRAVGAGLVLDVRNVTADSMYYGVDASSVDSVTIRDNVFTRVVGSGVNLRSRTGSRGPSLVAGNSISCTTGISQQGVFLFSFGAVLASDTITGCVIGFETSQALSGTRIRQSTLRNNSTGVYVYQYFDTTLIRIDSTGISGSFDGVYIAYGTVSLTHNRIENNTANALYVSTSQGAVTQAHDNAFVNNAGFAVNAASDSVDASANWWGAASAPLGSPPNGVSGRVNTSGFLTSAPPNLPGLAPPAMLPAAASGTTAPAPAAVPSARPAGRDLEAVAREREARREAERRARDEHRAAHEARRQRPRAP